MMNMNLLAVVTPPYIYQVYWKSCWVSWKRVYRTMVGVTLWSFFGASKLKTLKYESLFGHFWGLINIRGRKNKCQKPFSNKCTYVMAKQTA